MRTLFPFHHGLRIKSSARETCASLLLAGPFASRREERRLEMVDRSGLAKRKFEVVYVLCKDVFDHALFGRVCMIQCKANFPSRLRHAFPSGTRQIWMPYGNCSMMSCVLRRVQTQCVWPRPKTASGCDTRPAGRGVSSFTYVECGHAGAEHVPLRARSEACELGTTSGAFAAMHVRRTVIGG